MTLRTPRRRISPRTKQRYRAIKQFFKKAIGSASQPDITVNSSITNNVSELKEKIIGLEQQLSEVSKHCNDIIRLESSSRRESQAHLQSDKYDIRLKDEAPTNSRKELETKVLYKTSEGHYGFSGESGQPSPTNVNSNKCNLNENCDYHKKKNSKPTRVKDHAMDPNYSKRKSFVNIENNVAYSNSYHSLSEYESPRPGIATQGKERSPRRERVRSHRYDRLFTEDAPRQFECNPRCYAERSPKIKTRKIKTSAVELDQDFIADIIKRQYKPVKLFGRRESDFSQLSEPMCRDREHPMRDNLQEDSELCSCCYGGCHNIRRRRRTDQSDLRSICDTRLYSSKRIPRRHRHAHAVDYNTFEAYDLVPVKEKSSPNTRRKFAQDHIVAYNQNNLYREVPPSPKTNRPRLNLKTQYYTESEDQTDIVARPRRISPKKIKKRRHDVEFFDSDVSSRMEQLIEQRQRRHLMKAFEQEAIPEEMATLSSLHYPLSMREANAVTADNVLNKTQDSNSSADKTDKALSEIKDILKTFLQEIKKDTSQNDKFEESPKVCEAPLNFPPNNATPNLQQTSTQVNGNLGPNSGHSFGYSMPCTPTPSPFMPGYPNPCCYPLFPVYPLNCMQNSCMMPTPSTTCSCANKVTETVQNVGTGNETFNTETDELIKQIYKFVAESPTFSRKGYSDTPRPVEPRLTTRSAGGSNLVCRHDAKVGTPKMKCYSKSCEAIGSRMISDSNYSVTNSFSETVLENISVDATTKSTSESYSTEISRKDKIKKKKLAKVLRSLGLFKKKNKEAIEEETESSSSENLELNHRPPFKQNITNYAMYDQKYFRPPPVPQNYGPPFRNDPNPPYNPGHDYPQHPMNNPYRRQDPGPSYYPQPTAPPANPYENFNQPPLCLKEIEVKSIATQSERKLSFFKKLKGKMQPIPDDGPQRNCSTQTAQPKPNFWKNLQTKAMNDMNDPMVYSYKTQKKLAEVDMNMRNAMLKKLFYKRNPFSPRNLIIRTLLGKDKSSYGNPPKMYKPRMFL